VGGTTIRTGVLDIEGGNGRAATCRESGVVVSFIQSTARSVAAQPLSKSVVARIIAAQDARRLTIGEHGVRVSAIAVIRPSAMSDRAAMSYRAIDRPYRTALSPSAPPIYRATALRIAEAPDFSRRPAGP